MQPARSTNNKTNLCVMAYPFHDLQDPASTPAVTRGKYWGPRGRQPIEARQTEVACNKVKHASFRFDPEPPRPLAPLVGWFATTSNGCQSTAAPHCDAGVDVPFGLRERRESVETSLNETHRETISQRSSTRAGSAANPYSHEDKHHGPGGSDGDPVRNCRAESIVSSLRVTCDAPRFESASWTGTETPGSRHAPDHCPRVCGSTQIQVSRSRISRLPVSKGIPNPRSTSRSWRQLS
ncbi:hypothetical protein ACCO45_008852 [Purpureocillium lilacinum]|uniref:Uncharacterized protein n=1 Tax=Purpureocillium lilacinum TaxID=33203 RepID=A0ACC4DKR7_PURLI